MKHAAVHFGGGALGRGLVVPRLAAAGWSVVVVEPVAALRDALARHGGYRLVVADRDERRDSVVRIAAACDPEHERATLLDHLARATLVTTAVRKENLPGVARLLAEAWSGDRLPPDATVLGCENVEGVDAVMRGALADAGMAPDAIARIRIPRTVVDRICANGWPETTDLCTEPYSELAAGLAEPVPGVDPASDIDALFDRKRYLVNTFADAAAILGLERGHVLLSEAFTDERLLAELTPLLDALRAHLVAARGFADRDLRDYEATSRHRLANPAIPRRLDTVARDIRRKMSPTERFFAPLIDLARRRLPVEPAAAVVGRLAKLGATIERGRNAASFGDRDLVAQAREPDTATAHVYRLAAAAMRAG